jgi:hypothetical protein
VPGKANIRRRKRVARGLAKAAQREELAQLKQAAEEKEDLEFRETYEGRSRESVSKTMLVSDEGMDALFEERSE